MKDSQDKNGINCEMNSSIDCDNELKNDKKCCNERVKGGVEANGERCGCEEKEHRSSSNDEVHCSCGTHACNHVHKHDHGHSRDHHNDHHHGHDCGHDHGGCSCCGGNEHGGEVTARTVLIYGLGAVLLLLAFLGELSVLMRWVAILAAAVVYFYFGYEVWKEAIFGIGKRRFFTEQVLMCTATVGAVVLLEFADAAAVMYLYSLGEMIQGAAYRKSRRNIAGLIDITEEYINKVENGAVRRVAASSAVQGDIINVTVGEKISLDGVVVGGTGFADTSSVTGESVPRELSVGSECLSGSVLVAGAVSIRVTEVFERSTANKLKQAVERAARQKAKTEKKITRFASIFTPCAFVLAVLLFALCALMWKDVARALKTALVVLVVSCPCSLVLSVPLAYFSGIGKAAARGIVFRGGEVVDNAAALGTLVFDKTGTLTSANLDFDGVWIPEGAPYPKQELLDICRCALEMSPHAAARSFCEAYKAKVMHRIEKVNNVGGRGLLCRVDGERAAFGSRVLVEELGVEAQAMPGTAIYVVMEGVLCGALLFSSHIKPDTLPEIAKLRRNRVDRIAIMSGDVEVAVKTVAEDLGISEYYSQLKPDEKLSALDSIYEEEKKRDPSKAVGFCGDGLNDSAAIARADVGIAMGSGSAVTVECADVVIVDDSVARVNDMLSVAKSTVRVANQNIALSLGIKAVTVLIGLAVNNPSLELAIIADVGAAVVTVLNAMRAGSFK